MAGKVGVGGALMSLVLASVAVAVGRSGPLRLGPSSHVRQVAYQGFYDGHRDTYLITDVSSKSQAAAMRVNYSGGLGQARNIPAQYFVTGHAATGQLAVFGSEPGEKDYNPLWVEFSVRWKRGVRPKLLLSDNQINAAAAAHKVTVTDTHIVLNAPIIKVGK